MQAADAVEVQDRVATFMVLEWKYDTNIARCGGPEVTFRHFKTQKDESI